MSRVERRFLFLYFNASMMFRDRASLHVKSLAALHDESWTLLHLFVNPSDVFSQNSYTEKLNSAEKEDQNDDCRIAKREGKSNHLQHRIDKANEERSERDDKSEHCANGKRVIGKAENAVESNPQGAKKPIVISLSSKPRRAIEQDRSLFESNQRDHSTQKSMALFEPVNFRPYTAAHQPKISGVWWYIDLSNPIDHFVANR